VQVENRESELVHRDAYKGLVLALQEGIVKREEQCKGIGEDVPAELMDYVCVRVLDRSGADMVLPMYEKSALWTEKSEQGMDKEKE